MADLDLDAIRQPLTADARMDAYYYGFERTGVGIVDAILSAVAVAGKGAHHTESWGGQADYEDNGYYRDRPGLVDGDSAVDLIERNAVRAADAVRTLFAEVDRMREALTEVAKHQEDMADSLDEDITHEDIHEHLLIGMRLAADSREPRS